MFFSGNGNGRLSSIERPVDLSASVSLNLYTHKKKTQILNNKKQSQCKHNKKTHFDVNQINRVDMENIWGKR